jgi:hypothetical protein
MSNEGWTVLEVIPNNIDWKNIPPKYITYLIEEKVDMLSLNALNSQGKVTNVGNKVTFILCIFTNY